MPSASATPQTVMDPQAVVLAGVYAEAVLGLMTDEQAQPLAEELQALIALTEGIEGFDDLLATAGPQQQAETVHRIFGGRCSPVLEALLATLARNGRLGLLPGVADQFRRRLNVRQGRVEVTVVTARELDESRRRLLTETLENLTGAEPLVRMRMDPSLLGGVVVRVGDREYDGSVAGALKRMRRWLRQASATRRPPKRSGEPGNHED